MNSRSKLFLAMMGTAMVQAQSADNYYRYGQRKRYPIPVPDSGNGFSKTPIKVTDSRQLREFSIKGHKVMAFSKKDAITRLKHQKKI
ncbi:MAG: hypothetical protein HDS14_02835 [Bacteroides sp.]|nr:hypothetical protein [Bacteroides sp.]